MQWGNPAPPLGAQKWKYRFAWLPIKMTSDVWLWWETYNECQEYNEWAITTSEGVVVAEAGWQIKKLTPYRKKDYFVPFDRRYEKSDLKSCE